MASLRRILGLVVLVLGVLVVALPYAGVNAMAETVPSVSSGSVAEVSPAIYGGGTLTVSWSGAPSSTEVTLYSCPGDPSCSSITSSSQLQAIASATGSSGSISSSVSGGQTYVLTESGTSGSLSVTATVYGFGLVGVLGAVIAVIGVVLVVLPVRRPAAAPAAEAPAAGEPSEAGEESIVMAAPTPVVDTTPAPRPLPMPEAEEATMAPMPSPAVPAGGSGRAPIKCSKCGTMNEPWITNCRYCRRPLSSTG